MPHVVKVWVRGSKHKGSGARRLVYLRDREKPALDEIEKCEERGEGQEAKSARQAGARSHTTSATLPKVSGMFKVTH